MALSRDRRVRERAVDVERRKSPVEPYRGGETLDEFGHRLAKAAGPRLSPIGLFLLRHVLCSHIIER